MTETALAAALAKAGIQTDRIYMLATNALKDSKGNTDRAFEIFYRAMRAPARQYLESVAADMKNSAGGGRTTIDTQKISAPASPKPNDGGRGQDNPASHPKGAPSPSAERDGNKGHHGCDAHPFIAQPSQPSRDGAGHHPTDAQVRRARPVREPNAIERKAALRAAPTIFDKHVGGEKRVLGSLTRFDVRQVKRRTIIDGHIADRLITEISWPDDDKTALVDCATKAEVEAIFNSAYAVLDSMGVTNAAR